LYQKDLQQLLEAHQHYVVNDRGLSLNVVRYSAETLNKEFGDNFLMIETFDEVHDTPSKVQQNFIYCRFTKRT